MHSQIQVSQECLPAGLSKSLGSGIRVSSMIKDSKTEEGAKL